MFSPGLLDPALARGTTVFQQPRHQRRPSRLVAGAEPLAGVAVKVLVEKQEFSPVRIGGETLIRSVTDTPTLLIGPKDPY